MKKFPTFPASDLNEKRWLRKEQVKGRKKKKLSHFPTLIVNDGNSRRHRHHFSR